MSVGGRHSDDRLEQLRCNGDQKLLTALALPDLNSSRNDMLWSHPNGIAAALPRPEHELHCQSSLGAGPMVLAVLDDLRLGPCVEACRSLAGSYFHTFSLIDWIVGPETQLHRKFEQPHQLLAEFARGFDATLKPLAYLHLGTRGEFSDDSLTSTDVALLAGIEVPTIRNLVGPNRVLRSVERYHKRTSAVAERGFVAINRFDAIIWLRGRKNFRLGPLRPGLFAKRLEELSDEPSLGRAALLAGLVIGLRMDALAATVDTDENSLRQLGDGSVDDDLGRRLADHVIEIDRKRSPNTT